MSSVIAIAGKGGTGKTSIASLLIRFLKKRGITPILAVDADADSNLPSALGITSDRSIGTIGKTREEFFVQKGNVPEGIPKEAYLELKLNQVLVETKDIDLLVMGQPEGAGCYCFINNVLRKYLDILGKNYPCVIIDNEAGLEHLSRRTTQDVDMLLLVSNYSLNGLRAAYRIKKLTEDLKLRIGNIFLIINDSPDSLSTQFTKEIDAMGLALLGCVPHDELVAQYDIVGNPLVELPDESKAVSAFCRIADAIVQDKLLHIN